MRRLRLISLLAFDKLGWAGVWGDISETCHIKFLFVHSKEKGVSLAIYSHSATSHKCHSDESLALTLMHQSVVGLYWSYFRVLLVLWHSTKQASRFAPWAWQSPKISLTTPVTDVHQMLFRANVVTWGWWKYLPSPPGSWLLVHSTDHSPCTEKGRNFSEVMGDFGWLTISDLEVIWIIWCLPSLS